MELDGCRDLSPGPAAEHPAPGQTSLGLPLARGLFTVLGQPLMTDLKEFFSSLLGEPAAQALSPSRQKVAAALANAGLIALWCWLYRAVYAYLAVIFTREEFRTNQIVLLGVLALIVLKVRKGKLSLHLYQLPQLYRPALALSLGGSLLYLLAERFLNINTFSATLFGLASYGLLGLWMAPSRWRQGLPAALLLVGALPFGDHMQTFIGYPVRILTATAVRDGLSLLGIHSVGVDTILVFENGFSKVDLPCSGVKSLWTGGLFFLAASWIERRTINARWMLAALGLAFLLLLANLVRVAILVGIGHIAGWRLMAEMLHVPLGVLGFVGACALGLALLRRTGRVVHLQAGQGIVAHEPGLARPAWLTPLLVAAVLVMALLYAPKPAEASGQPLPVSIFPPGLATEPWTLTPGEQKWLADSGVETAERWRFEWRGLKGSLLLVTSDTWRAHHRPERCFEVYGLTVEGSRTELVAPDFPVRLLSLGSGKNRELLSAAYWLQSAGQTTDDYAARIWADLAPRRERWVLVTILFDRAVDPGSDGSQALYTALRGVVHKSLTREE
jgi:exosortase O